MRYNEADKVAKELRSTSMTLTGGEFCGQEILVYFLHMCLDGMVILNFHHHFHCTIGPVSYPSIFLYLASWHENN
jgi:phosphate starvation-inducible membrane PsiE